MDGIRTHLNMVTLPSVNLSLPSLVRSPPAQVTYARGRGGFARRRACGGPCGAGAGGGYCTLRGPPWWWVPSHLPQSRLWASSRFGSHGLLAVAGLATPQTPRVDRSDPALRSAGRGALSGL